MFKEPELERVAQEVEATIVTLMKEAASGWLAFRKQTLIERVDSCCRMLPPSVLVHSPPEVPQAHNNRRNINKIQMPIKRLSSCLFILLFICAFGSALQAQMNPYFTAINYPVRTNTMMVMLLPDFQSARTTRNFFTGMGMVQYGVTPRWTVGFMVEGQKILGLPVTYGGLRVNSYFRVFPHDQLLNFTVYGEYEGLNAAALYKMEVAGFGGEDLSGPLAVARRTHVRTFEQRAIIYHDWGRTNLTFNFISETGLDSATNDFGYSFGVFRQPAMTGMDMSKDAKGMAGMAKPLAPPALSFRRMGYGLEMIGALGDTKQFGFDWPRQQQYVGPVFSYSLSRNWSVHMEPAFGLSDVSDPFVLRMGVGYSIDHFAQRLARAF